MELHLGLVVLTIQDLQAIALDTQETAVVIQTASQEATSTHLGTARPRLQPTIILLTHRTIPTVLKP